MTLLPLAVAALYAVALFTLVHAIRNARTAQGAVGWAVFILAFDTRFPRGWFERTMEALLTNG